MPTEGENQAPKGGIDAAKQAADQSLLDTLGKLEKPDTAQKAVEDLQKPETTKQIRENAASMDALIKTLNNPKLTDAHRKILEGLLLAIDPVKAFNRISEKTNKPSGAMESLMKDGKLQARELASLSKEQIQDQFKTMNKKDLAIFLNQLPDSTNNEKEKNALALVNKMASEYIGQMIKNGFSIEQKSDIELLETKGPKDAQETIKTAKNGLLKDFDETKKFIIQEVSGKTEVLPITKEAGLPKSLDLSKMNTASAPDVAAKLNTEAKNAGVDPDKIKQNFAQSVDQLLSSNNPALKGLGELMKFFGSLLGFYKEGNKKAPETKKLDEKGQITLLGKMIDEKNSDKGYALSKIEFENGKLKHEDSTESQAYLKDLYVLCNIPLPAVGPDGKTPVLTYNEKLQKEVKTIQEEQLGNKNADGIFNMDVAKAYLTKLGGLTKKPEVTPAPKEEVKAPEVTSEIPAEKAAALKLLEGKKTKLTGTIESRKAIQTLVGAQVDGKIGAKTIAAIKVLQGKLGIEADGKFGPDTLKNLKAKPEVLSSPKATPEKK